MAPQFRGAVKNQCVPPGNTISAMQARRPQKIGVRRPMNEPSAEIRQDLLGPLAGHPQLLRGRNVKLRKHLNAQRSAAAFREAPEECYGSIVLGSRAAV